MDPVAPVHPGEILMDEFMVDGLGLRELSARSNIPEDHLARLIEGARNIDQRMAIGLSEALGTTSDFWANLQNRYDLQTAGSPSIKPA